MAGVVMMESRAATERRRVERAAAIQTEIEQVPCGMKSCGAGEGEACRTTTGRLADQPHRGRLAETTARVDARLGWHGYNPARVDVDA
ncbi:zinc finger domain-containing protein [Kitasatospora fiedleri]|uniref:zinc finger domain-containing protein n=1 Tax=Kitasatospora fiedleri TaxID=2991545 RepID=UPI00249A7D7B|nr:hypothetical protein [Kitasatospora fiedleri]